MFRRRFDRIAIGRLSAIAALALPLVLGAALTSRDAAPSESLAGQLLIASPSMGDPRFEHAVILMVKHDREGAFGIVINRPVAEHPLSDLLIAMGELDDAAQGSVRIYAGGPVEPSVGFVIHSTEYKRDGTVQIDGHVAMTANREVIRDIAHGHGPKQVLVAFGYAGWGPGQLDGELADGDWFTAPEEPGLVFDSARETLWRDAMGRRTRDL